MKKIPLDHPPHVAQLTLVCLPHHSVHPRHNQKNPLNPDHLVLHHAMNAEDSGGLAASSAAPEGTVWMIAQPLTQGVRLYIAASLTVMRFSVLERTTAPFGSWQERKGDPQSKRR